MTVMEGSWSSDQVALALYDLGVSRDQVWQMFCAVGRPMGDREWRVYWRQIQYLSVCRRDNPRYEVVG